MSNLETISIFNILEDNNSMFKETDIRVLNKIGFDILKFLKQYVDSVSDYKLVSENVNGKSLQCTYLRNSAILALMKVRVRILDSCSLFKKVSGLDKDIETLSTLQEVYKSGIGEQLFDDNFISDLNYCCYLFNADDDIRFSEVMHIMNVLLVDISNYGISLLKYKK